MRKITFTDIVIAREHYKKVLETRQEALKNLKETKAPKVIIEDYEKKVKEARANANGYDLALEMYKLGFIDGKNKNYNNLNLLPKDMLKPEERLVAAIFAENDEESKKVKEELACIKCDRADCTGCALEEKDDGNH